MAQVKLDGYFGCSGKGFTQEGHWEAVELITKHFGCKEAEDELWASIQRLERAVSVLTGSNPQWRVNVSKGDAQLIDMLLATLTR